VVRDRDFKLVHSPAPLAGLRGTLLLRERGGREKKEGNGREKRGRDGRTDSGLGLVVSRDRVPSC